MALSRRRLLGSGLALPLAAGLGVRARTAEPVTIRMGVLKLVHSITPYFYERFLPEPAPAALEPAACLTLCPNGRCFG